MPVKIAVLQFTTLLSFLCFANVQSFGFVSLVLQKSSSLETKGGPVQTLAIHDVTRFYSNDLVVVDSRGMLTVFCNEQILNRRQISDHCIQCLQVQQEASKYSFILLEASFDSIILLIGGSCIVYIIEQVGHALRQTHLLSGSC